MSYSADYLDISEYIPQEALDIQAEKPDIRTAFSTISAADEGYGNRSGDLANLIEQAAANNQIVDLGSGTYEMESGVNVSSGTVGVVGDSSSTCTVYYNGTDVGYLFDVRGPSTYVNEGVTYDITEPAPNGLDTDVGLTSAEVTNRVWCEDIELRGQRHYLQDYDGDGRVESPSASRRFTFLIEMTTYSGRSYLHNCRFPDGGTDEAWRSYVGTVGHAIGPNADPSHIGINTWHQCHAEGFMDNGFYVNHSPGRNILWDCTARNNAAGNFRLGDEDYVVGGYAEITNLPNERLGQCLGLTGGANITVIGLECYANSSSVGDSMIQIRNSDAGDTVDAHLEKVVGHFVNGNAAIRQSGYNTHFEDCYIYDENTSGTSTLRGLYGGSSATGANLHIRNENGSELYMQNSTDTFTYGGTTYSGGSWSASTVGFDDPLPLPDFGFGDTTQPTEYEAVFKIVDESGATLEGATVSLEGQTDIVTGADGIADFGVLPTGDYAYSVVLSGYASRNGTYTNDRSATHTISLTQATTDDAAVILEVGNQNGIGIEGVDVALYTHDDLTGYGYTTTDEGYGS